MFNREHVDAKAEAEVVCRKFIYGIVKITFTTLGAVAGVFVLNSIFDEWFFCTFPPGDVNFDHNCKNFPTTLGLFGGGAVGFLLGKMICDGDDSEKTEPNCSQNLKVVKLK